MDNIWCSTGIKENRTRRRERKRLLVIAKISLTIWTWRSVALSLTFLKTPSPSIYIPFPDLPRSTPYPFFHLLRPLLSSLRSPSISFILNGSKLYTIIPSRTKTSKIERVRERGKERTPFCCLLSAPYAASPDDWTRRRVVEEHLQSSRAERSARPWWRASRCVVCGRSLLKLGIQGLTLCIAFSDIHDSQRLRRIYMNI